MREPIDYDLHWRESLETYRSHPTSRHRRRFVVRALRRYPFTPTTFVFDYGCGTGLVLDDLRRAFGLRADQLGGCDTSEQAILRARQDLGSQELHIGSFPALHRPIDVAVCTEVIEHVPDYTLILEWLRDHVAPAGVLILTTPSVPMDPPDEWYGHVRHFSLGELADELRGLGFRISTARRWGFPLFTLQKWVTRRFFRAVRDRYMEGALTRKKRVLFALAYRLYLVHDLIPGGPQIFIVAKRESAGRGRET